MAVVVGVNLSHEVFDFVLTDSGDVLAQHELNLLEANSVTVLLIEHAEALFGFFLSSLAGDPSVGDDMLNEGEVDTVTLLKFAVALDEVSVAFTLGETVEAKVVQDVTEVGDGDHACLILVVEVESFLEVGEDVVG